MDTSATCNFIKKENLAPVFSYELWETFKNTYSWLEPPSPPFIKGRVGPSEKWVTWGGVRKFLLEREDKPEKEQLM